MFMKAHFKGKTQTKTSYYEIQSQNVDRLIKIRQSRYTT
jgi:hypothetical protein